jgi:hypothetical protein
VKEKGSKKDGDVKIKNSALNGNVHSDPLVFRYRNVLLLSSEAVGL